MNKKLTLLTLAGLTLAGASQLSAATWKVKNSLGRDICVTINTGVSQIRRFIANGAEVPFTSKACLYSISVKEGSVTESKTGKVISLKTAEGRCPSGLANISKITIKEILDYSSATLMKKGKAISAAENKTKAGLEVLKVEVQKLFRMCRDMSFEVVNVNGQAKIVVQGVQVAKPTPEAKPAPTPISPAPPVVMPTTPKPAPKPVQPPVQAQIYIEYDVDNLAKKYNFYDILEISATASPAQIKNAYYNLSRKYHPDKNLGNKEAEEKFKLIGTAHTVLSDKDKKALYDKYLAQGIFIQQKAVPQVETQPAPTPISPAPPVVMPTTEKTVVPPAPPVMPTTPKAVQPTTSVTPPPAPPVMPTTPTRPTVKPEKPTAPAKPTPDAAKQPAPQQPESLLEEIRARGGKGLKPISPAELEAEKQRKQEAIKSEQQKMLEKGFERTRLPEFEETEEVEGVWEN